MSLPTKVANDFQLPIPPIVTASITEDLGCEAVRRLTVKDMPLTVILDAHGGDLYQSGPAAYLEAK